MTQKPKYLIKKVAFAGKDLTLYSLDGLTWSSRKDELPAIVERHNAEKVTAAQLRGEIPEGGVADKGKPVAKKKNAFNSRFTRPAMKFEHPAAARQKGEALKESTDPTLPVPTVKEAAVKKPAISKNQPKATPIRSAKKGMKKAVHKKRAA